MRITGPCTYLRLAPQPSRCSSHTLLRWTVFHRRCRPGFKGGKGADAAYNPVPLPRHCYRTPVTQASPKASAIFDAKDSGYIRLFPWLPGTDKWPRGRMSLSPPPASYVMTHAQRRRRGNGRSHGEGVAACVSLSRAKF
ncbi:hypothetical protein NDU88_008262 [Pleurodeles waltl]|uniref:Uncharacterized protein n=1 Tax=Pleurodeles waltl TaxID=8319 RepID=A0AAV7RX57_PLEWA|nr:hypothetical protein NDU88_008262 [Pleurodeles waltl]